MRRTRIYVTMITLGLTADLLLLHLGRNLQTSHSVRGEWIVQIEHNAGTGGCAALRDGRRLTMSIAQSGPDLEIRVPDDTVLLGNIEGRLIRAAVTNERCTATLASSLAEREPGVMRGAIEFSSQPPARAAFTAMRTAREPER